ncbi:MAG: PAS domain S-box protein [Chryseobacterium sp.]|nr:MAG: PAS domain S-box protein [Chryseobacterium sp.]
MGIIKASEAKDVWKEIAKHTTAIDFSFELEIHKKLLNIFHIGDFYYYIFNCATAQVEYVSNSMCEILGYSAEEFNVDNVIGLIHPEDISYFLDFEQKVTAFFTALPAEKVMKYKVSYDYRMKRNDGQYVRLLHQASTIQSDSNGAVIRVLGVHTDITRLKKDNGSTLSFIGLEGELNYEDVSIGAVQNYRKNLFLSKRERQVLIHLAEGKTSREIGDLLFISKFTVDRHRKNMLKKTNISSTVELAVRSIQENWV